MLGKTILCLKSSACASMLLDNHDIDGMFCSRYPRHHELMTLRLHGLFFFLDFGSRGAHLFNRAINICECNLFSSCVIHIKSLSPSGNLRDSLSLEPVLVVLEAF